VNSEDLRFEALAQLREKIEGIGSRTSRRALRLILRKTRKQLNIALRTTIEPAGHDEP